MWSQSLGIRKRAMVWLPPSYASQPRKRYPVAYYLHGAFGDETNWLNAGRLAATLDSLVASGVPEMIVVMPDGDDGFYTTWNYLGDWPGCRRNRPPNAEPADAYCVPWPHYDEYIARDVVQFVDRRYRTLADRRHRGIAGLSMGGYGAVALALSYPDVFSAAASHSGVLAPAVGGGQGAVPRGRFDFDSLRASWSRGLWALLPPVFGKDSVGWAVRDPANLAARLLRRNASLLPALYVDCGTEDFLLHQNRAFRDAVRHSGGQLQYREHPGSHNWDYWRSHSAESAAWLAYRLQVP
ncbi:MAG TPA: alpha/beta hydrolase family protein [Gemmatimonadaceae bacterium]|nr:alpha/beta hydrolase family protein [Gemmatimonadaceae bacterium]